jgi:hypothetical protein
VTRFCTQLRLPLPAPRPKVDDYDVDALAIEFDGETEHIAWRLELGRELDVFWVLPTDGYDRLRLVHVDSAVRFVDEPTLIADPFSITVPTLRWTGENLGVVRTQKGDRILVSAEVSIGADAFAFEAVLQCPGAGARRYCSRSVSSDV